jgi:tight adherence protein B
MTVLLVLCTVALWWAASAPARPRPALSRPRLHLPAPPPGSLDIAHLLDRLAAVLGTGVTPQTAWRIVADAQDPGPLQHLARSLAAGGEVRQVAPAGLARSSAVQTLAVALDVSRRSGAPLAAILRSLADALRDLHDASQARRSAFAGPRSTARILLALPVLGIGLGMLLGADPLATLLETGPGRVLLAVGLALTVAGWWWMRRLMTSAEHTDQPATTAPQDVDPSVVLDLVAGTLRSGQPLAAACRTVGTALADDGTGTPLRQVGDALASGLHAEVAARRLPASLAELGRSALLAERSGADLAELLTRAARDTRRSRARDAEAAAARLAVRLVLPTGVTLLPAFVAARDHPHHRLPARRIPDRHPPDRSRRMSAPAGPTRPGTRSGRIRGHQVRTTRTDTSPHEGEEDEYPDDHPCRPRHLPGRGRTPDPQEPSAGPPGRGRRRVHRGIRDHRARRLRLRRRPGGAAEVGRGEGAADGHHHLRPVARVMNRRPLPAAAPGSRSSRSRCGRLQEDRGSATAETAIVLPVVVMMVLVILVAGVGIGTQVQLESAARTAAREMARGESEDSAIGAAQKVAGDEITVSIGTEGDWVRVQVTRPLAVRSGPLAGMSWQLDAQAQGRREPHLIGADGAAP